MSGKVAGWLLLHGTPLTPAVWDEVRPRLEAAGPVFSPAVTPGPGETQQVLARRIVGELPVSAERLNVVGHSFGGQVALEVAILAPDLVESLTVLCSRDTPYPPFAATATALRNGGPVDLDAAMQRWFRPDELTSGSSLVAYARGCLEDADLGAWATALEDISVYDRGDAVTGIRARTTLISAEDDPVSTPEVMGELAQRIPAARIETIAGARHMSPFMDVEALATRLESAADW